MSKKRKQSDRQSRHDQIRYVKEQCLWRAGFRCQACGDPSGPLPLQLHHIKPLSRGGKDTLANTCILCADCHKTWHASGEHSGQRFADWLATRSKYFKEISA